MHSFAANPEKTAKLMGVLQSDASFYDKARACQQLGEIGTKEAVQALAPLLSEEHLAAYARSGLEGIADPSAAAALREALKSTKGSLLAGVINSLGAIRDAQAVEPLCQLAGNPDSGVVKESLLALGRVASEASVSYIRQALASGPANSRADAAAAVLISAERLLATGKRDAAAGLYDEVRRATVPVPYRIGATRGAILARASNQVEFLVEQLRSEELIVRNAALLTIREIPSEKLADALISEIKTADPEFRLQLLKALVDCPCPQAAKAIRAEIDNNNPEIQKWALANLHRVGGVPEAKALLQWLAENKPETPLAMESLAQMEGSQIDDLILEALPSAGSAAMRVNLIRLLQARNVTKACAALLKLSADASAEVGMAAARALNVVASPADLAALIALVKESKSDAIRNALENTVCSVCSRSGPMGADAILTELKQSKETINSWIRILITLAYPKALPSIIETLKDSNETIADNTAVQLARWPNPTPVEELFTMVDKNATLRNHAWASAVKLVTAAAEERQCEDSKLAGWFRHAQATARTVEEKRLVVSGLAFLKHKDAFTLLMQYREDPALNREAMLAIVQIAPSLAKSSPSCELKEGLEKLASTATDATIARKAREIADSIPASKP